ncbi:uncharacterized protein TRIADDRAFT_58773 [Trichoplax adhaerens]|uniref:Poly [ADP-ribose] polymerase n=1 Tax=Trichoplax adhaerens TaxID=10228 RepID=B3S3M1_TRIAD|nr:hypothetical protein TRIADDRAFT_58773 [Trichoplax adhaerens]EDV22826.1 hypothetical protein TRIADDRAFT_58773 [Trichoplax adhaerens]|eukprot:XP_002114692.1 hypothetical protein TRIADDRAFT_58773 [Trichoplax adhaerens]
MAIPAIGAGHVGIKAQDLAREMISTTCKYLLKNADTSLNVIAFVILDQDIYDAYTKSIDAAQIELNSYCQESNFSTNQLDNGLVDQITKCKKIPGKIEEEKLDTLLTVTSESNAKLSCNFCFGVMHAVQTSAVINTTHICHLHQSEDHLSARLDSTVKNHCLESIHVDKSTQSDCSIFKVCPYGLIDDFGSLLACVNANENTSISCPLASTEITEEDIKLLIQAIYLFLDSHKKSGISLQRIDFITGNRELAYEIASWAQHQFENAHKSYSDYTIAWQITRPFSYNNFGKNVTIVASRYEIIEQIESLLASYAPSWTCVVFAEEDMLGYDEETWHALIQDWWCHHSTLMIRNTNTKQLQIYGYKNDIFTTYSNFQKSSSLKTYQSAMEENRKELLETVQWNVNIKQAVHQFDLVMNYQLEIDYQAYLNDKTKSNVILDGKSIDFIRMAITVDTGMSYPIWRKFALEDSLPASWQSAEADTQKDELKLIVEVRNQAEIQEISELVRAKGIDLIKLQRIQNRNLYRRYQLQKAEVTQDVQQYQPGTVIERRLFHRTNENNVNSICKSGFDRDYSGKSHGSALGNGTYFATEPSTTVGYGRTLILARVLTGICNTSGYTCFAQSICL